MATINQNYAQAETIKKSTTPQATTQNAQNYSSQQNQTPKQETPKYNYVNVGNDGNAPTGTKVGDIVVTAGGNFKVVEPNTPGARYNPSNGLWSIKVEGETGQNPTQPSQPSGPYVPTGVYNDQGVSAADKAKIEALAAQWELAKQRGDINAMNSYHAQAEAIRKKYGYSGGADGSEYNHIDLGDNKLPSTGLPSYTPQEDKTNDLYDAAKDKILAQLEKAYNQSKIDAEYAMSKIPGYYQDQKNQAAAQAEIQRRQWNQYAAAGGIGTGVGAQANLAMGNALQGTLGKLGTAEANAMSDMENQLFKLKTAYQDSISEAVASNEYERAAALLKEYQLQAQSIVENARYQASLDMDIAGFNRDTDNDEWQKKMEMAEVLAKFGDFSGYKALGFTDQQIANMRTAWGKMNPYFKY